MNVRIGSILSTSGRGVVKKAVLLPKSCDSIAFCPFGAVPSSSFRSVSYIGLNSSFEGINAEKHDTNVVHEQLQKLSEIQRSKDTISDNEKRELASTLFDIAKLHHHKEELLQAKLAYEEALKYLAEGKSLYARSCCVNGLATVAADMDDLEEAELRYKESLVLRRQSRMKDDISFAETYNNLGAIYQKKGYYQKAAEKYEDALSILEKSEKKTPDNDRYIALTLYNLGLVFNELNYPQSQVALAKALRVAQRAFPEDHSVVKAIETTLQMVHEKDQSR